MTEKTIIECDGTIDGCSRTTTADDENTGWTELLGNDDKTNHLCPVCSLAAWKWAKHQRSEDQQFNVSHDGTTGGPAESVAALPGDDANHTHSVWVTPVYSAGKGLPDYDPSEEFALHVHIRDHAGITIIGDHKQNPRIILEPGEFDTRFEVREDHAGHSFSNVVQVEDSIKTGATLDA